MKYYLTNYISFLLIVSASSFPHKNVRNVYTFNRQNNRAPKESIVFHDELASVFTVPVVLPPSRIDEWIPYLKDKDPLVDRERHDFMNTFRSLRDKFSPLIFKFPHTKQPDPSENQPKTFPPSSDATILSAVDLHDQHIISSGLPEPFTNRDPKQTAESEHAGIKAYLLMPLHKEDVSEFIISIPSRCPPGQEADYAGSCREIFPTAFDPLEHLKTTTTTADDSPPSDNTEKIPLPDENCEKNTTEVPPTAEENLASANPPDEVVPEEIVVA